MKRVVTLFCTLLIGSGAAAQAQTHWSMAYPLPTGNGLLGAAYGNGLFVAVGFNDTILASSDGIKWLSNHSESPAMLLDVAYGNGRFVAVGAEPEFGMWNENSLVVRRSADGMAWTDELITNPGYALRKVSFAMDRFIGIGETPDNTEILATSLDGLTWTERWRSSPGAGVYGLGDSLPQLADGGDRVVLLTSASMLVSTNGVSWIEVIPEPLLRRPTPMMLGLASNGGRFVAMATRPTAQSDRTDLEAWVSSDGLSWQAQTIQTNVGVSSVIFGSGGGRCVLLELVERNSTNLVRESVALTSEDGLNWSGHSLVDVGFMDSLSDLVVSDGFTDAGIPRNSRMIYGQNQFVDVGTIETRHVQGTARVLTSPDAVNWTRRITTHRYTSYRAAASDSGIVALASQSDKAGNPVTLILKSGTGPSLNQEANLNLELNDIAYGSGGYVAVGLSGIFTSKQGSTWSQLTNAGMGWGRVRFDYGRFLAGGQEYHPETGYLNNFRVGISINGNDWEMHSLKAVWALGEAASDGESVVVLAQTTATATNASIFRLETGDNWTEVCRDAPLDTEMLAYGNGRFVAMPVYDVPPGSRSVMISDDGTHWTHHRLAFGSEQLVSVQDLIFAHGEFYAAVNALNAQFDVLSSADGEHWDHHPSHLFHDFWSLAAGPEWLLACGSDSLIAYAPWDAKLVCRSGPQLASVTLRLTGHAQRQYQIESSSTLENWQPAAPLYIDSSGFADLSLPTVAPRQFFRAVGQ